MLWQLVPALAYVAFYVCLCIYLSPPPVYYYMYVHFRINLKHLFPMQACTFVSIPMSFIIVFIGFSCCFLKLFVQGGKVVSDSLE